MSLRETYGLNPDDPISKAKDYSYPIAIQLVHQFSYYDSDGIFHTWPSGVLIQDPVSIRTLVRRHAPYVKVNLK